ncbi:MAG: ribosomal-processing cysteine protease Prp [Clostridia bacterium]|nr:ribosomal-processing cysteine protease Prp [Clostridia bacterium]
MVQIDLDVKGCRLRVQGHAGTAPYGQDLVCAALSALTLSVAENVKCAHTKSRLKMPPRIAVGEGECLVTCQPKRRYRTALREQFDQWAVAFALMARLFPERIQFRKKGANAHGRNDPLRRREFGDRRARTHNGGATP